MRLRGLGYESVKLCRSRWIILRQKIVIESVSGISGFDGRLNALLTSRQIFYSAMGAFPDHGALIFQ